MILARSLRFVNVPEMIAAIRVICFTIPLSASSFCVRAVKALSELLRPTSFGTRLVGLASVFFCYHGFCGTISVADLQKRFEVIAKAADGKVGVAVELLETKESILLNGQ